MNGQSAGTKRYRGREFLQAPARVSSFWTWDRSRAGAAGSQAAWCAFVPRGFLFWPAGPIDTVKRGYEPSENCERGLAWRLARDPATSGEGSGPHRLPRMNAKLSALAQLSAGAAGFPQVGARSGVRDPDMVSVLLAL